jgi:peptidyl-prolyl cis-trans isomerase D
MLTTIREKAQGWIAWVIVIIISIPFALWGINEYLDAQEKIVVAEVNDMEVYSYDFQEEMKRQRLSLREQFDGRIDNKLFQSPLFKKRVLNEMIGNRLVSADIREQGYYIGDAQLALYLKTNPAFQVEGVFSPELYTRSLNRAGVSVTAFENQIRNSNIVRQIKDGFSRSVISYNDEVDDLIRLYQEKRDFNVLVLKSADYRDKVDVADSDIQQYYEANKKSFMTEEMVRAEYITLSLDSVADQISPDEETLQAFYNERKDQYTQPEQRQAQHILLAVADDADEEEVQRISELASDLVKQAREGRDFGEMARKFSIDSISSAKGGDLGFFEKGVMDDAFDEKAFAMQEGEISDPVRSRFGFHIIKLNKIKPQSVMSFADARESIRNEYAHREASLRFGQLYEEMQNLVFEQPTTLQPAADALGLEIRKTGWFSKAGGDGMASHRAFVDSAFTEDVLYEGLNSEVVETTEDNLVALRVLDHKTPEEQPLAEVSNKIREILVLTRSREMASKDALQVIDRIRSGDTSLEAIAKERGIALEEYTDVGRTGTDGIEPALLNTVFKAPAPGDDQPVGFTALANGDQAVFTLQQVVPGDPSKASELEREQIKQVIQQRKGEELFADYERGLFEMADIVINEEEL